MRALDVGHGAGVQIEPFLAEDGVPAPADELMYNDQEPNCEMIDFRVHKSLRIIQASELGLQVDSGTGRSPGHVGDHIWIAPKALFHASLGTAPREPIIPRQRALKARFSQRLIAINRTN